MRPRPPSVVLLAGPNGAGKSTVAPLLLRGSLQVAEFVNADEIARGLSGFAPGPVGMQAGRLMLDRIHDLARERASFGFETTLASRTFAPWIRSLVKSGYRFQLVFLWLPSPDLAVQRVRLRVKLGGHDVPEAVVRRRYGAGLHNFFRLYRPIAARWRLYDASAAYGPRLVALGSRSSTRRIADRAIWRTLETTHGC